MITLNLVKGEKVDLTKGRSLETICFAAGWDINSAAGGSAYDLDIFAVGLGSDKKPVSPLLVSFFGGKNGLPGAQLDGDNLTGEGDGDDETITVSLSEIPANVEAIAFGVNIYEAQSRGQRFGMVQNSYIRAYDKSTNEELIKYDLNEDYGSNTGVYLGIMYKHNGEWKFEAKGLGVNGDINDIIAQL